MTKVTGPLFSLTAKGTIAKTLTYQERKSGNTVYRKSQPGQISKKEPTADQYDQRGLIAVAVARWQTMNAGEKANYTNYQKYISEAIKSPLKELGLLLYYSNNKITANKITDLSKNNQPGSLKPNPPGDCPTITDSVNDKFCNALNFDGINDYIQLTPDVVKQIAYGSFTIMMWNKLANVATYRAITCAGTIGDIGILIRSFNNDTYITYMQDINGHGKQITTTIPEKYRDKWQHYAITREFGSKIKIHINGELINDENDTIIKTDELTYLTIGSYVHPTTKGKIDEYKIFNRALGADEINKNYKIFRK